MKYPKTKFNYNLTLNFKPIGGSQIPDEERLKEMKQRFERELKELVRENGELRLTVHLQEK